MKAIQLYPPIDGSLGSWLGFTVRVVCLVYRVRSPMSNVRSRPLDRSCIVSSYVGYRGDDRILDMYRGDQYIPLRGCAGAVAGPRAAAAQYCATSNLKLQVECNLKWT
jgi:hypothetical protein